MITKWDVKIDEDIVCITIDGSEFADTVSSDMRDKFISDEFDTLPVVADKNRKIHATVGMFVMDKINPVSYVIF